MDNQKVIDKIKKLLELASSPNENEAKTAMDAAMRLMAKYSIDDDIISNENSIRNEIVTELYSNPIFGRQGVIDSAGFILATIAPLFGCYAMVNSNQMTGSIRAFKLVGFKTNLEITKYALDSLFTQGVIEAKREFKKHRTLTFGGSFWSGFAVGLNQKFGKMSDYTKGIVVYDKVKEYVDSITKGSFKGKLDDGIAYSFGVDAGRNANIRSAISSEASGKLLK